MNWDEISKQENLSEDFMRENANHLNWELISKNQILSVDFIKEMDDFVKWACILRFQKNVNELIETKYLDDVGWFSHISYNPYVNKEKLLQYATYFDWNVLLFTNPHVREDMQIEEYKKYVDWETLHKTAKKFQRFDLAFLRKYKDYVDWLAITARSNFTGFHLTEEIINEMKDYIHWDVLLSRNEFDEAFLEQNQDKIIWDIISETQRLTENFIETFSAQLNWGKIAEHQDLSYTFVTKHIHKIDISKLQQNKKRIYTLEQWHYIKQSKKEKKIKSTFFSLTTKLKRKIKKEA